MLSKLKILLKNLGPGLLFASMAIGTSHLVLSTKAGAQYGWVMVIPILLANVFKYPFFEFGVRYTNVTGKTLTEGYLNRGKTYLWFYGFITLVSTFTILAALYTVTAGLFINLLKISHVSIDMIALALFCFISILLIVGKYRFMEVSLKFIVSLLFIALLATMAVVIFKGSVERIPDFTPPPLFDNVGILFLISLMGWMPTTVEASSWVSLWSVEKWKTQAKPSLSESLQEFRVGYYTTCLLALFFLTIGCMTLYGTQTELSGNAVTFADQIVQLFTAHIGPWAYILISVAAFATMFSTCMTAHDAIARVSIDILELGLPRLKLSGNKRIFAVGVIVLALVNYIVVSSFSANMGQLVSLATFVSFVVAPIVGYMNLKNVMSDEIPQAHRPKKGLRILTYTGILFLSLFSVYYFYIVVF
ncbi:NRAMP family divalent metal transporter [Zobellia galactanivorans]|uniref:NRAMP family divalent metal transporter n=1 Tax=Zobellia galactanivorans (strain DSM 12802 / CCUG 47099 / CIP 106680 / NCIMB 13871 / Dsij) TaxID=63186 RepID=UPI001C07408D|nr:divalent metal cation transporter [Zobellia galactanivorans]MBU3027805.1 divalent metal cation transporter [Zobellia galactanivorans]